MKKILVILSLFLCASQAYAYDYNPMETVQEARARHSAENYNTYQQRGSAPLGGYSTKLGDPSPRGTITPGYANSRSQSNQFLRPSFTPIVKSY